MCGWDNTDVEEVDRNIAYWSKQSDFTNVNYDKEDEKREKEEKDIPDETGLFNLNLIWADQNAYDPQDNTRHKERTSQDAVESNGTVAGWSWERHNAGKEIRSAISQRKKGHSCNGRGEPQDVGQTLQGTAKVVGSRVTQQIKQHYKPQGKEGLSKNWEFSRVAVEDLKIIDVSLWPALEITFDIQTLGVKIWVLVYISAAFNTDISEEPCMVEDWEERGIGVTLWIFVRRVEIKVEK